jgi:hypothetical protein
VLRGLSDRGILLFLFILLAFRTALSLSSLFYSSRNDLFTDLGLDVHGHTALAVHRAGAVRRPPLTGNAGLRYDSSLLVDV